MSINILILIGIVVLLFYIKVKVSNIHDRIDEKINEINDYAVRPVKKVVDIASSFFAGSRRKKK